ncbi:nuclear transport factor 2 family protein [candidate division WOR-3 bacterium]|nr:nuclear transport factor 2 family protein [candidate division WOR-3 bacterium]
MKNFILLFSFLLIFISCEMKKSTPTQENVEQAILAKERQALDHWAQGDPLGFSVNFADDVTYFDDIAAHTRIDSLEEMQNYLTSLKGKIPPHSYEIVDPKVQVYGDIAILTLRYHPTSTEGEPGPPWKATSVYKLTNGEWHVVHAHWSLVKEQ